MMIIIISIWAYPNSCTRTGRLAADPSQTVTGQTALSSGQTEASYVRVEAPASEVSDVVIGRHRTHHSFKRQGSAVCEFGKLVFYELATPHLWYTARSMLYWIMLSDWLLIAFNSAWDSDFRFRYIYIYIFCTSWHEWSTSFNGAEFRKQTTESWVTGANQWDGLD